jgi:hypothetical protein
MKITHIWDKYEPRQTFSGRGTCKSWSCTYRIAGNPIWPLMLHSSMPLETSSHRLKFTSLRHIWHCIQNYTEIFSCTLGLYYEKVCIFFSEKVSMNYNSQHQCLQVVTCFYLPHQDQCHLYVAQLAVVALLDLCLPSWPPHSPTSLNRSVCNKQQNFSISECAWFANSLNSVS